mmetsp:Transcript_79696/g.151338  ORF Transcript_79696/g.151338 Transcript_79696/m.151338 type:complete len:558 (-) Transcript_79696:65-1738(-)
MFAMSPVMHLTWVARYLFLCWLACGAAWNSVDAVEELDTTSLLQQSLVLSSGESQHQTLLEPKPHGEVVRTIGDNNAGSIVSLIRRLARLYQSPEHIRIASKKGTMFTHWQTIVDVMPYMESLRGYDEKPKKNRTKIQTNTSRKKTVLNETEIMNESSETTNESAAFANVTVNTTVTVVNVTEGSNKTGKRENITEVVISEEEEADIASPEDIIFTHICVFVPLGLGWFVYFTCCKEQWLYLIILPLTLCCCQITQHLVNQSLVIVTRAPYGITSLQSFLLSIFTGVWSLTVDRKVIQREGVREYYPWLLPAVLFGIYQVFNHLVSYLCTLSERTVFNNLCPVVTVIFETFLMPTTSKPKNNLGAKIALLAMVVGAIMFSSQSFDFTESGISMASLMVCSVVACRITQRLYLSSGKFHSLSFLSFIDGVMCLLINLVMTGAKNMVFVKHLDGWLRQPSIVVLIVLSSCTFTGSHISGLALLRVGSATAFLVFLSLTGFIEVALGIVFFGDLVFQSPLSYMGLGISLASGLWYSTDMVFLREDKLDPARSSVTRSSTV